MCLMSLRNNLCTECFFHTPFEIRLPFQRTLPLGFMLKALETRRAMNIRDIILNYRPFSKLILLCFSTGFVSSV